jgi:mannose-1-phosphate guanylyltransferase
MSTRYVVVMAGGSGTRFWPKSRGHHPKQLLAIGGDRPLLRSTVDRVLSAVPKERILVVTAAPHAPEARAMLAELPEANVLVEPEGRNTAPCIGWATHEILRRDPEARIAVLPADHFIGDVEGFLAHLDAAFEAAGDRIVLFGIVPSHPETGYGYIRRGGMLLERLGKAIDRVERFVEKPDRETAIGYLQSGDYLWNSGMFVFSASVMAQEIERLLPELDHDLRRLVADRSMIGALYPKLQSISIDYGVMEKSDVIAVMPAQFGWSDVGSWDAAFALAKANDEGNVLEGDAMVVDSRRTMVDARAGRFVAAVGVEDVIIVDTQDALLVIKRGESQQVKHVVEALKSKSRKELL